ncbi:MAG: hypothetical protein U1E62_26295 [Alsobacter sp.]
MLTPKKPTAPATMILVYWSTALVLLATVLTGLRVAARSGLIDRPAAGADGVALAAHLASCALLVAALLLLGSRLRDEKAQRWPASRRGSGASLSWRRADILVRQAFVALVAIETSCAVLLVFGGGPGIGRLHLAATLFMIAFVPLHVAVQLGLGGADHVLRMFRPAPEREAEVPLGRLASSPVRSRGSTRLFGLSLGLVFGAAAAAALLTSGASAAKNPGRSASTVATPVSVAWSLHGGLAR